jgi:biopolymer transport protein ExbB
MSAWGEIQSGFLEIWAKAETIWVAGGFAMTPIAIVTLVMFALGVHVWLRLREKGFESVPEKRWRTWIHDNKSRKGPIGSLIDAVSIARDTSDLDDVFNKVQAAEVKPFERDLKVMKVCVGLAPLLGLFGTVTGMLATFNALAEGSGGDQTMAMIAKGISEALITTEAGLVVALPGLFFQYFLARKFERYRAFLAHLETVCTQALHKRTLAVATND